MKSTKVLIFIIAVLFSATIFVKESKAQDKWEIVSVSGPSSCKLNANNLTLKVKIKNIGSVKSAGTKISINVLVSHEGENLGGNELDFAPGMGTMSNIGIGKTTTLNVLVTNENFRQFTNIKGDKSITANISLSCCSDAGVTKIFSIKVK